MESTPYEKLEVQGRRIGRIIWKLSSKHRTRAVANLTLAYPEMPAAERLALAERVLEHFGIVTADFLAASKRTEEQFYATTDVEGWEHFEEAYAMGKGIVLITGHFGNWERMSEYVTRRGFVLSVVARDASDVRMNQMVNNLRSHTGTRVIPRGNAARPMIEALRRNELVGILPDQNSDEIFLPFFGHPAGTVLGPGVIAERTGAPVVPMFCVRTGPGRYKIIVRPIVVPPPPTDTKGESTMLAIHQELEATIRKYPEQWLWFHDRWKSARQRGLTP
ncbi:MAG: lysophospholipid acyltransferase family protein [Chthonomonas sp.]|nr:lysophospholipid acyltransferase family protein [Chthonomonas sp.]